MNKLEIINRVAVSHVCLSLSKDYKYPKEKINEPPVELVGLILNVDWHCGP